MFVAASGEMQPLVDSTTVQCIVVPGEPASNTIWREPCPAVMTPPESVHVQLEPGWLTTLADAPDAPTGTESGEVMTGVSGVALTVTVTDAELVEKQPFDALTVSAYTVVDAGDAVGLQLFGSDSPVIGSHEQDWPPEPVRSVDSPEQIVASPLADAVGRVLTVRTAVVEADRLARSRP
jgi:hypothetical protein